VDPAPAQDIGDGSAAEGMSFEEFYQDLDRETYYAAEATLSALHAIAECQDAHAMMSAILRPDAAKVATALLRQIGERATADVIAQELYLKGHRESGQLDPIERLVIVLFVSTLRHIEDFKLTMKRLYEEQEAEKNKPAPRKIPLEDTMLEPSEGPMERTY